MSEWELILAKWKLKLAKWELILAKWELILAEWELIWPRLVAYMGRVGANRGILWACMD